VPSRRSSPRRTARARARSRQDGHAAGVAGSPHWPPISSEGGPRHLGPHAAAFSHVPVESGRALQTDRSDEVQVRGATPSLPFQKCPQNPAPFCPQFRVVRQQWGALEQCKAVHSAVLRNSFAASLAPRVAGVPCQHGGSTPDLDLVVCKFTDRPPVAPATKARQIGHFSLASCPYWHQNGVLETLAVASRSGFPYACLSRV
jgi:hypothetical protein